MYTPMRTSTLVLSILATFVTSAPTQGSCSVKSIAANANFDDLALGLGALGDIPVPYKGLYFQAFRYNAPVQTGTLPLVVPHSAPNYAFTNVRETTLKGTTTITTNFPKSQTISFDLESFYFGCNIMTAQGSAVVEVPAQCDVAVTGYSGPDNEISSATQICSQQFRYNPTTQTGVQQQAFGAFQNNCKNLTHIIFQYTFPGGLQLANGAINFLMDDFKYAYKTCA